MTGGGVEIVFRTSKLRKQCTDDREAQRTWGSEQARRLKQRLDDLDAAANLGVLRRLPGRAHELKGNRADQISLDLKHPYRLIVESANNPVPRKSDGGLDWDAVTAVRVLEITDTHD